MGIKLFITYTNLNLSECKEKQRQQSTCHAMTQYPSKISSRDKAAHQPALWRARRGNEPKIASPHACYLTADKSVVKLVVIA